MATACPRCQGFLTAHTLDDQSVAVRAARCVNCGHIAEPVMNTYKHLQQEGVSRFKTPKAHTKQRRSKLREGAFQWR